MAGKTRQRFENLPATAGRLPSRKSAGAAERRCAVAPAEESSRWELPQRHCRADGCARYSALIILLRSTEMNKTEVILSNIQDVRDFVNIVVLLEYEVDLAQGRYLIDAKSIMGIFSLDLLSPITVIAHTEYADDFFAKIEKFKA